MGYAGASYELIIRPIGQKHGEPIIREAMTTCEWCPYSRIVRGQMDRCGHAERLIDSKGIPAWCPLKLGGEVEQE